MPTLVYSIQEATLSKHLEIKWSNVIRAIKLNY